MTYSKYLGDYSESTRWDIVDRIIYQDQEASMLPAGFGDFKTAWDILIKYLDSPETRHMDVCLAMLEILDVWQSEVDKFEEAGGK